MNVRTAQYSPINDKDFATWSPEEGSSEAAKYYNNLLEKITQIVNSVLP